MGVGELVIECVEDTGWLDEPELSEEEIRRYLKETVARLDASGLLKVAG
jgi:hypothetical protein